MKEIEELELFLIISDELSSKYQIHWLAFPPNGNRLVGRYNKWSITLYEDKINISDYDSVWDVTMPRRYISDYGNPKLFDEIDEMLSS